MNPKRNSTIDSLRGLATLAMILIHTTYYFLSNNVALFIWNWSQFAVPIFIFCSGYVFFLKQPDIRKSTIIPYFKKRLLRLLIPYYIFLIFFFPIIWFVTPAKLNMAYFLQSLVLIGGVDINWLVLLVVQLAIIFPLLSLLRNKRPLIFYTYLGVALLTSVVFIFTSTNIPYRYIMWVTWSLAGIAGLIFIQIEKLHKKYYFIVFAISLLTFLILYLVESVNHHDLSFYGNKYPPTLYLLTYGVAIITGIYWLAKQQVFNSVQPLLFFISKNSYSIYFIHYCLLIFFASFLTHIHTTWYFFFSFIFFLTLLIRYCFSRMQNRCKILIWK